MYSPLEQFEPIPLLTLFFGGINFSITNVTIIFIYIVLIILYFSFVFSSVYAGLFKSRNKYDIIIVSSPPLFVAITAYILSLVKRVPFIFEIRDLWPESAIDTGILQNKLIIKFAYFFESYIYERAKLINVLTPAFRYKLIQDNKT